jgi:hypothetical protein
LRADLAGAGGRHPRDMAQTITRVWDSRKGGCARSG